MTGVSNSKLTRIDKVFIIVVLMFILVIGGYDISYSKNQPANKEELVNNHQSGDQVTANGAADTSKTGEQDEQARKMAIAKDITIPVASNATTDAEKEEMAEYSAVYADDIQSYTVAEIADAVANDLGITQIAALDQLTANLPKNVDVSLDQYQLVNKLNPLLTEPDFEAAYTADGKLYNGAITDAYTSLLDGATAAGYTLATISAHRTIAYQADNVARGYQIYLSQGYSAEEAEELTNAYYAPAEASEHSTGLAFDWLGTEWTSVGGSLDEGYAGQPSAQWLAENAQDYGFILRYPRGKEQVTGYSFEPWHYRYVGVEAAQYIAQYNITLEEFLALVSYQAAI